MREELEFRIQSTGNALQVSNSYPKIRAIHNQLLDLERNILQVTFIFYLFLSYLFIFFIHLLIF